LCCGMYAASSGDGIQDVILYGLIRYNFMNSEKHLTHQRQHQQHEQQQQQLCWLRQHPHRKGTPLQLPLRRPAAALQALLTVLLLLLLLLQQQFQFAAAAPAAAAAAAAAAEAAAAAQSGGSAAAASDAGPPVLRWKPYNSCSVTQDITTNDCPATVGCAVCDVVENTAARICRCCMAGYAPGKVSVYLLSTCRVAAMLVSCSAMM